jgi:subfamily B ATP-binding cassette protein MsbA
VRSESGREGRAFARHPQLLRITRRWFWAVPVIAFLSILIGLLEGLGVGLLVPLVSTLAQAPGTPLKNPVLGYLEQFAHQAGFQNRLLIIVAAILGVTMLKNILFTASRLFSATLYGTIGHHVRLGLSDRIEKARYEFFLQADPAHLVNVLNAQSWQAVEAVRASFTRVASISILAVMSAILLFIEWRLALIVAVGGMAARAVQRKFVDRIKAMSLKGTASNDTLTSRMMFSIFGARMIRLFDEGKAEHRRFTQASDRVRGELLAVDRTASILSPALETFHAFLFIAVLIIAVQWDVQLPILAAFLVLFNRMQPHLRALEQASGTYAAASGQLRDVDWLLDPDNVKAREEGDMPFTAFASHIRFDRVSFDYQGAGDRPRALSDVDFTVRRGTAFAVIGQSGAGKSTLINLLAGLIEPTQGEIRIDGVPLNRLKRNEWLGAIAIAGQDIELFEGTIAENIAFGTPDADTSMIAAAARDADAGFILSLPEGFATRVGDRGLALSGGQRQRIGIARALIRKPEILILDEATNAIDRPSENAIVEMINALPQGTTAIVISHRSATLRLCDTGIVLDNGRMVETGPLDTLAEYRAMRDREMGFADPDASPTASRTGE